MQPFQQELMELGFGKLRKTPPQAGAKQILCERGHFERLPQALLGRQGTEDLQIPDMIRMRFWIHAHGPGDVQIVHGANFNGPRILTRAPLTCSTFQRPGGSRINRASASAVDLLNMAVKWL